MQFAASAYMSHITSNHWRIIWNKINGENLVLHIFATAALPGKYEHILIIVPGK